MTPRVLHTLPALQQAVRGLAESSALPVETRARLVLAVSESAGAALDAGQAVTLEVTRENGRGRRAAPALVLTLRTPGTTRPPRTGHSPLPARTGPDGSLTWRVPLTEPGGGQEPHRPPGAADTGTTETAALEEELRAALARVDALVAEKRRLTEELEETNTGVLALYVQLEERDERLRKAHGQTLRELEDALRPPPLTLDGLELAVHYAPAGTDAPTGGDLYDWFLLPDGTVHITIVDALGHGVRSTRSALNVTHAVRTLALEGHPLESIVARTHEIFTPFDPDLMATVLLARLHPATGELHLANGSHPPALVVRADGTAEFLEVRGRGVGFPLPGSERLLHTRLDEQDLLVLYTDGLTESRRNPLEGEQRLIESVLRHRNRPIREIPGALAEDMHAVILHSDDTLALTLRRTPQPG
ncbi:SpoIIE family protein phosphatase [Streptomyces sp. NPDC021749]|uniref:PP2C family protein-serine/threonine phosphatase n=1 Tax=Streptomyces sp. NPDC021749 TaxID=3154905 RepID=UPI0033EB0A90